MTTETWKDVAGYEGRYQVSDMGRVMSVAFKQRYLLRTGVEAFRQTKSAILAQQGINSGYQIVHLHLNNKRVALTVHRLVAKAFVHGEARTVNHIDGVKSNNCASNLEWTSYTENLNHAVELGLNRQAIRVIDPLTQQVYPSIAKASRATHQRARTVSAGWGRA